jgi:hypothetical protein
MESLHGRSVRTGIIAGLVVGLFFSILEMVGAAAMGAPALSPWHAFASTVLGRRALEGDGGTVVVGIVAHFVLSAIYGGVYGLYEGALSDEARHSWSTQVVSGLFYGIALYLLNFQVIARLIYPWFLGANQPWQFLLHGLFFGVPLGLAMAYWERHESGVPTARAPSQATHA